MVHALLIEDDRKLASLLREFLAQHGVEATVAEDAAHALRELQAQRFDILLLDLMLPGMDGLSLTRRIRERWKTPIIMVTARGDDADKIVGLELGADDYLAKPFNPRELLARIRAVLRRAPADGAAAPPVPALVPRLPRRPARGAGDIDRGHHPLRPRSVPFLPAGAALRRASRPRAAVARRSGGVDADLGAVPRRAGDRRRGGR